MSHFNIEYEENGIVRHTIIIAKDEASAVEKLIRMIGFVRVESVVETFLY